MSETPESSHQKAASKHAKKRAIRKPSKASKKTQTKKRRVIQTPLEPFAPMELTGKQRKEVSEARDQANKADTEAALARPTALTPLQQKRLEFSEAKKAALKARKKH